MSELETCENCGRLIGRLERAHSWNEHVVCAGCKVVLESQPAFPGARPESVRPTILSPLRRLSVDSQPLPQPIEAAELAACAGCGAVMPREHLECGGVARCAACLASEPHDIAAETPVDHSAAADVTADVAAIAEASNRARSRRRRAPSSGWGPWAVAAAVTLLAFAAGASLYYFRPGFPTRQTTAVGGAPTRPLSATRVVGPTQPVKSVALRPASPTRTKSTPAPPSSSDESIFSEGSENDPSAKRSAPPSANQDTKPRARAGTSTPAPAPSTLEVPSGNSPPVLATPSTQPEKLHGVEVQFDRGKKALNAGDYRGASAAFKNALDTQRSSPQAMHGLALASFYLAERNGAIALMEKAFAMRADRAIAHNLAVLHLRDRNPMRAAKFLRDYLSGPSVPLDEPLQNVLGAALRSVGDNARTGVLFSEIRNFYFHYDDRLATARGDGLKRWGMTWIPPGQADYKWQQSKARSEEVARLELEAGRATVKTKHARDAVHDFRTSMALKDEREERRIEQRLQTAFENERVARENLDGAQRLLDQAEMPPFPKDFEFIPIDALTPDKHPPQR
jgi:hypothetical protein